jgi:hypothetical protein
MHCAAHQRIQMNEQNKNGIDEFKKIWTRYRRKQNANGALFSGCSLWISICGAGEARLFEDLKLRR